MENGKCMRQFRIMNGELKDKGDRVQTGEKKSPAGDKADDTQFVAIQLFQGSCRVVNILFGGGSSQGEAHRTVGLVLAEAKGQEGMGRIGVA